jgi:hypothetical protein
LAVESLYRPNPTRGYPIPKMSTSVVDMFLEKNGKRRDIALLAATSLELVDAMSFEGPCKLVIGINGKTVEKDITVKSNGMSKNFRWFKPQ